MAVIKWDPFQDMIGIEERVARIISDVAEAFAPEPGLAPRPSLDLSETKDFIIVKAELPGVKKDDITLRIENRDTLLIKGESRRYHETSCRHYHCLERAYGSFERRIDLPAEVDRHKVKALFRDGVLVIYLPKLPPYLPHDIEITDEE